MLPIIEYRRRVLRACLENVQRHNHAIVLANNSCGVNCVSELKERHDVTKHKELVAKFMHENRFPTKLSECDEVIGQEARLEKGQARIKIKQLGFKKGYSVVNGHYMTGNKLPTGWRKISEFYVFPKAENEYWKPKGGDLVKLKTGSAHIRIDYVTMDKARGYYVKSGTLVNWRDIDDFEPIHPFEENEKEIEMTTLYQTKEDKPRFGTKLAINAKGQIVLDMKGTGIPEAFDKDAIEEVTPWTFSTGKGYHWVAAKGAVKAGDLVYVDDQIQKVTAIDTKERGAVELNSLLKIVTEKVDVS